MPKKIAIHMNTLMAAGVKHLAHIMDATGLLHGAPGGARALTNQVKTSYAHLTNYLHTPPGEPLPKPTHTTTRLQVHHKYIQAIEEAMGATLADACSTRLQTPLDMLLAAAPLSGAPTKALSCMQQYVQGLMAREPVGKHREDPRRRPMTNAPEALPDQARVPYNTASKFLSVKAMHDYMTSHKHRYKQCQQHLYMQYMGQYETVNHILPGQYQVNHTVKVKGKYERQGPSEHQQGVAIETLQKFRYP
jgi:hypothetical protein